MGEIPEAMVEAVAKAIYDAEFGGGWEGATEEIKILHRHLARAALEAAGVRKLLNGGDVMTPNDCSR